MNIRERIYKYLFPDITNGPSELWKWRNWGINGSPDWGEPSWPGWKQRKKETFWESEWPSRIIIFIGILGGVSPFIFFFYFFF